MRLAERLLRAALIAMGLTCSADALASPGMVLPEAPSVAPGRVQPLSDDALGLARERYRDGDPHGVVTALTPWLDSRQARGREKAAGHLLLGMAHRDIGNWNLSSYHFTRVRVSGGPLAPWGAWYEAEMDHNRGRHLVAVRECNAYRETWPEGHHADECLLLIGDAYAAAGHRSSSLASYKRYLELHPDTPRAETVRLGIALAVAQTSPQQGIRLLQEIVVSHSYHSSALTAQARLDELADLGHDTTLPDDPRSRMLMAESARRCGRLDDAWRRFEALVQDAADNPEIARWVETNEDRFAWLTRQYDVYADALLKDYEENPRADIAWRIFNAYRRDGNWKDAASFGRKAEEAHGSSGRWRWADEDMAWVEMLAQEHDAAHMRWADLSERGRNRTQSRFYAGFCAYLAGDLDTAEEYLTKVVDAGGDWEAQGLYWRAKVRQAAGDADGAGADRQMVLATDDVGWYSLLVEAPNPEGTAWVARDGLWQGPRRMTIPEYAPLAHNTAGAQRVQINPPRADALLQPEASKSDWGALTWYNVQQGGEPEVEPVEAPEIPVVEAAIPDGIQQCVWYDPDSAERSFTHFSESVAEIWPELRAARDLSLAGMDKEAGNLVHEAYIEWKDARNGVGPRAASLSKVAVTTAQWREYFLFARDYNHAARFCWNLGTNADNDKDRIDGMRLAYPIVEGRSIWRMAREYNVDPLMMMAIMRQESVYKASALSVANAVGLVQVLPSTGAKVAAMLGEPDYSPGDLEVPDINVRYGTYYMSRLLERFEGIFPMAVASYNGGPHNMSRFYKGFEDGEVDMDVFVEHIAYDESRDYVKKVTGHYRNYVALYAPEGARVVVPEGPRGDDRSVVDF